MPLSELKQRVSQDEINTWIAYVDENGPLNQPLRIESAIARAVAPFLKNVKPRDLMPWPREPERELKPEEMALQLASMLKAQATKTKQSRKH